jgi:FixJ family two-component response regulator
LVDGNGSSKFGSWVKDYWQVLVGIVFVIAFAVKLELGYADVRAEVDSIKEVIKDSLGGPSSLPVIQEKVERIEKQLEKQEDERDRMMDVMERNSQKVDSLIDLLVKDREDKSGNP